MANPSAAAAVSRSLSAVTDVLMDALFYAPLSAASACFNPAKAAASKSIRSSMMLLSHSSTLGTLCNRAKKAARVAKSGGNGIAVGISLRTKIGSSHAEPSSACATTILSICSSERHFSSLSVLISAICPVQKTRPSTMISLTDLPPTFIHQASVIKWHCTTNGGDRQARHSHPIPPPRG